MRSSTSCGKQISRESLSLRSVRGKSRSWSRESSVVLVEEGEDGGDALCRILRVVGDGDPRNKGERSPRRRFLSLFGEEESEDASRGRVIEIERFTSEDDFRGPLGGTLSLLGDESSAMAATRTH